MYGKRTLFKKRSTKPFRRASGGTRRHGVRRAGGTRKAGFKRAFPRRSSRRAYAVSRKSFRGKRSIRPGFKKAVVRALGVPAAFETASSFTTLGGFPGVSGAQYSSLASSTVQYLFEPNIITGDVLKLATGQAALPQGTATMGFTQGAPLDFYVEESSLRLTYGNQTNAPVSCCLWRLKSRFDQLIALDALYAQCIGTGFAGDSSALVASSAQGVDTDCGSTPFNYRPILQCWKVMKCYKFRLNPGMIKVFNFKKRSSIHVTARLEGLDTYKQTEAFHLNVQGYPVNQTSNGSSVTLAACKVNCVAVQTHRYLVRPLPYTYSTFLNNLPSVATPTIMEVNNPTSAAITTA